MISKADKKLLRKLKQRKFRWLEALFIAEGPKVIEDLRQSGLKAHKIWSIDGALPGSETIDPSDLQEVSQLSTPNQALAIFPFPTSGDKKGERVLILDKINDPGNLGTLIRSADWFGFESIFALPGTADCFNFKTVQATMGSLARVQIQYLSAQECWEKLPDYRIIVADMTGSRLKNLTPPQKNIALVLGSESHGPSAFWQTKGHSITIPKKGASEIDSLNVAVAGGILMQALS